MTTAAELFHQTDLILLDFDGPVTRLLPPPANAELAAHAREAARKAGVPITDELESSTDHLAFIRAADAHSPDALQLVESLCTAGEIDAAATSPVTPGAVELLQSAKSQGKTVVIVTNNSSACAVNFLAVNQLSALVEDVIGRDPRHIDQMKPSPTMLQAALLQQPGRAVMIGDSVSDITAAKAAGLPSIALAKNEQRATELDQAGTNVVIRSMRELAP